MYILQCPLHHHQDIEPFRSIVLFYNQQILGSKHFSDLFLNHRLFLPISELRIKGYMQYIVVCTSFILLIIMFKIHPYGSPCQQFSSSVVFSFFFFCFLLSIILAYAYTVSYLFSLRILIVWLSLEILFLHRLREEALSPVSATTGLGFSCSIQWRMRKGQEKQIYRLLHISFLFGSTCYLACLLFQSKTQYQFRNKIVTTHTINECFQEK